MIPVNFWQRLIKSEVARRGRQFADYSLRRMRWVLTMMNGLRAAKSHTQS